jgi:hypothetical protein
MTPTLTREFITDALAESILDPRLRALYELCFMHRHHLRDDIVADKLRMLVRLCAERGIVMDDFSPEYAAHRLGRADVDRWFGGLATAEKLDVALLLEVHKHMMRVFDDLGEVEARSLASKYLHFHFPELFFVFDSRVEAAAIALGEGECGYLALYEHDPVYGRYYACARKLVDKMAPLVGRRLSPRELDRVLRAWHVGEEAVAMGLPRRVAFEGLNA